MKWILRAAASGTLVVGAIVAAIPASADTSTGLVGYWSAVLTQHEAALPVVFSFARETNGRYSGRFSCATQAVMEYPLVSVSVDGQMVKFELSGDSGATVFSGRLAGNKITGKFSGDLGSGTLAASRTLAPSFPYTSENIRFKSHGVTLAGSVYIPKTAIRPWCFSTDPGSKLGGGPIALSQINWRAGALRRSSTISADQANRAVIGAQLVTRFLQTTR